MEVVPYFLSIIVTVIAVYWSAREYRRKPGTPISGLFRYQEVLKATAARTKAGNAGEPSARPWHTRTPALSPPATPPRR